MNASYRQGESEPGNFQSRRPTLRSLIGLPGAHSGAEIESHIRKPGGAEVESHIRKPSAEDILQAPWINNLIHQVIVKQLPTYQFKESKILGENRTPSGDHSVIACLLEAAKPKRCLQ